MAKCGVIGCGGEIVGGFQAVQDAGNFQNPDATIPGRRRLWCEEHEDSLKRGLGQGKFLTARQLEAVKLEKIDN